MADFKDTFENWAKNPVFLAGREQEMATLKRLLVLERRPIVGLVGPRGIGKTTLAFQFIKQHSDLFPGGTWHVGMPFHNIPPPSVESSLVVFDDSTAASQEKVKQILAGGLQGTSKRQYIIISQSPRGDVDTNLELKTLRAKDIVDIFRSLLLDASPQDEELLVALTNGYPNIAQLIAITVRDKGLDEGLRYLSDFFQSGIVDSSGNSVKAGTPSESNITSGLVIASDEVIRRLAAQPELMHRLSPREFETLVAELLNRQGYEVELTPISRDGGKDIYVAHKSGLGSALYVVECKRYSPNNPVGVGIVRALYGIVQAEQLTGGIVATTSYFTRDARKFQESVPYQMSLSDYDKVREWLSKTLGGSLGTT